jgi:pimeloyl-ACP methyl ester carboxylesterase
VWVAELLHDGAHLLGHSFGGLVAVAAAARRPDAVKSLVLSDGRFPKSKLLGSRCTVWVESEIDEWLDSVVDR